ncbi:MAG: cytochrome c3 family protein [Bacteroidetes bacterium]|nr:cytochrome c3 family protein [Bacteroidota bacterium]
MRSSRSTLLLFFTFFLLLGCSPKTRYHVLSFFFDGVPDYSKTAVKANNTITADKGNVPVSPVSSLAKGDRFFYHSPFYDQACLQCHDKSSNSRLIKEQPDLCYTCHAPFAEKFKYVHGPVAGGYCTACHAPHKSVNSRLLIRQGQQICLYCHSSVQIMKNEAHAGIDDSECTMCHDPHGGSDRLILK